MSRMLEVRQADVAIGGHRIVENLSLGLAPGTIACLLGPSGCGKTTLLRAIAGFVETVAGDIRIDGEVVSAPGVMVPVERRNVGMVFQDFALFPHLSVAANIGFGIARAGREARVLEVATMLGIADLLEAFPHRLSGGQQQRVAVARAMAPRPQILLLDEPFSGLDIELREQIARDIRGVLKKEGITAMLVTHNQAEAFAMADEVGIMRSGRLLQWGSPRDLYYRPALREVANFIGEGRFLPGHVLADGVITTALGRFSRPEIGPADAGRVVDVLIRPDMVELVEEGEVQARVREALFRGAQTAALLELPGGLEVLALVPGGLPLTVGDRAFVRATLTGAVVFLD
ncbi:MAG: ABC transporter ATP-binding protein [Pseudomonadota bacterium]